MCLALAWDRLILPLTTQKMEKQTNKKLKDGTSNDFHNYNFVHNNKNQYLTKLFFFAENINSQNRKISFLPVSQVSPWYPHQGSIFLNLLSESSSASRFSNCSKTLEKSITHGDNDMK